MQKINRLLNNHKKWLEGREIVLKLSEDKLRKKLGKTDDFGLPNCSVQLGVISQYYGVKGLVLASDLDPSASMVISHSLSYTYWLVISDAHCFSKTNFLRGLQYVPDLTFHGKKAACLLATAICLGDKQKAEELFNIVEAMISVDGVVRSEYKSEMQLECFVAWLYSKLNDIAPPSLDFGVYDKVVSCWDDVQALSQVMEDLCIFHLDNTTDSRKKIRTEFTRAPFDLIPFELLAIFEVRKQLGLDSIDCDHALIKRFSEEVKHISFAEDDLLSEFATAFRQQ